MRLRTIASALALTMAMPAVAHAETWAHWKHTHRLHFGRAPSVDPDHLTPAALREVIRFGLAQARAELRRRVAYESHERSVGHFVRGPWPRRWTVAEIQRMIESVFGRNAEALRVAACESHDNPYAQNASGASGVFQLMPEWWAGRFDPFDPMANIREAYRMSNGGMNWGGWQCA